MGSPVRTGAGGRRPRLLRGMSVAVPLGVVLFVLVGFADIVPVTFSGVASAPPSNCSYCSAGLVGQASLPSGVGVTLRWTNTVGTVVTFQVWSVAGGASASPVCRGVGTGGTLTFRSVGGTYEFTVDSSPGPNGTYVEYSGTYWVSLL